MGSHGFKTCSTVKFSSAARLLPSSWCPDKDLVLIITRTAGKDGLALWPREGGRKMWEVGIDLEASERAEVSGIAWSPDGLSIAVSHHPPAVTLHSLQDGHQDRTLTIPAPTSGQAIRLAGLWWFSEIRPEKRPEIPDVLRRQGGVTGSAHSILKTQPLLDALHDDSQPLSTSELFAFQGKNARTKAGSSMPSIITSWPTLPADLAAAGFDSKNDGQARRPGEELDEIDDSNVNSILMAADDAGNVYAFLDGSYPLGTIGVLAAESGVSSIYKSSNTRYLFHPRFTTNDVQQTLLKPMSLDIPFLDGRIQRDIARVSTSARELAWYAMRVAKEMRGTWFGSDTQSGAREAGPKWLRALQMRQKTKFGVEDPNAILDLTVLLATGRASESLSDFLGSSEQMSERSLQKWETSVTEALFKLRDFATKRIAPACQRLHVLLQEVLGWSQLPQYKLCMLKTSEIQTCLDLIGRAIVCASWLAATTRREWTRFKEFIAWIRTESSRASKSDSEAQPAQHDLLEVNEYLVSGLAVSSIDKWFMGPVPQFSAADLGVPMAQDLTSSVQQVRDILDDPEGLTWPPAARHHDLSGLDRNLDSLIQDVCTRCHSIFNEAANASARSAVSSFRAGVSSVGGKHDAPLFVRERTVDATGETNCFMQHLAIGVPHGGENLLCLVKMLYDKDAVTSPPQSVEVAALQCSVATSAQEGMVPVDVLDAQFFDENILVIVYRPRKREDGPTTIATVGYAEMEYSKSIVATSDGCTREGVIEETLGRVKDGQISSVALRVMESRALVGCREGRVALAVNGRVGRRVACVLGEREATLEIMDVEPSDEETEEMDDA